MIHCVIEGSLYITQASSTGRDFGEYRCFRPTGVVAYYPFCDDFGPMNMASLIEFIRELEEELQRFSSSKLIYTVDHGKRALSNAVFLLGAYMILKLRKSIEEVTHCFGWLNDSDVELYRDATFSIPDFGLSLLDCWQGLAKGISCGWVQCPTTADYLWGCIDVEEYAHYENPLNADLHQVVPGKFVAFKGPEDIVGAEHMDDKSGYRHFSPAYYFDIFKNINVNAVVRLNEPEYERKCFEDQGIAHFDLEFDDCTCPPARVVEAFFRVADSTSGLVAVHCKAGLGRTGTLIGLYMMRTYGFSAREAIAWLRIMRPGSVIAIQQHYLCGFDGATDFVKQAESMEKSLREPSCATLRASSHSAAVAAELAAAQRRRGAARVNYALAKLVEDFPGPPETDLRQDSCVSASLNSEADHFQPYCGVMMYNKL